MELLEPANRLPLPDELARWVLQLDARLSKLGGKTGYRRLLRLPIKHILPPKKHICGNRERWQYHCNTCQHWFQASDFRMRPSFLAMTPNTRRVYRHGRLSYGACGAQFARIRNPEPVMCMT